MSALVTATVDTNLRDSPAILQLDSGQTIHVPSNAARQADEIPVIDIAGIFSDRLDDRKAVAERVREASSRVGFFYMINPVRCRDHACAISCAHWISGSGHRRQVQSRYIRASQALFPLPEETKMELYTGLVPDEYVGYHLLLSSNRDGRKNNDLSEAFNWAYDAEFDPEAPVDARPPISIWPDNLPGFREKLYAYHTQLLVLARRMSRLFALALGMPEDYFDKHVRLPEAAMRVLHYPEQDASADDQNGIGPHTDFECFTIVTQDENDGLEVLSKSGEWIKAPSVPGALVVNIADCFMRQTNDFFVSTIHRVINKSGKERYSAPFFFGFDRDILVEPVPSCVSEENPAKYPVVTFGEYYRWRANTAKAGGL